MPSFDLSARLKLRLTGSDRVRFLNGQVTNDVRKANAHLSMAACVLSAKGKMDALIFINAEDEAILIDADPELKETLAARLERYLIADDVAIEDVTKDYSLFHVTGKPRRLCLTTPIGAAGNASAQRAGTYSYRHGTRIDATTAGGEGTVRHTRRSRALAIEEGVPRWGRELTAQIIPVEAGSRATRSIMRRLLHRPGSDFAHENVRANEQTLVWIGFDRRHAARARMATVRPGGGKGGRQDHERDTKRSVRQRNCPRLCKARHERNRHTSDGTSGKWRRSCSRRGRITFR
jgi:glycine cleavage system aminomethyltransferase T